MVGGPTPSGRGVIRLATDTASEKAMSPTFRSLDERLTEVDVAAAGSGKGSSSADRE